MADQYGRQTAKIEKINNNHSISLLLVTTWDILLLYSILMIDLSARVFALSFRLNDISKLFYNIIILFHFNFYI